jgi:hypothetical protein
MIQKNSPITIHIDPYLDVVFPNHMGVFHGFLIWPAPFVFINSRRNPNLMIVPSPNLIVPCPNLIVPSPNLIVPCPNLIVPSAGWARCNGAWAAA